MRIIGGARWLDEPLGQNIGGLEPLGPHEVGAYVCSCLHWQHKPNTSYEDNNISSAFCALHVLHQISIKLTRRQSRNRSEIFVFFVSFNLLNV